MSVSLKILFLFLLLVVLAVSGCGWLQQETTRVIVEFRPAQLEPDEGLTEMTMSSSGEKFYVHKDVLLGNADIASASVTTWNSRPVVQVVFTEAGGRKFAQLTEEYVTRRVAILVDGRVVSAPVIRVPILDGIAIIDGGFSEEEAERIADGIVNR